MRELFGADLDQHTPLVRDEARPVMQENGVRFEEMASGEKVMDPSYIRVPAGAGSEGFYSHNGEEFVYVVSGTLYAGAKGSGHLRVERRATRCTSRRPPSTAGGQPKSPSRPSMHNTRPPSSAGA